MTQHYRTILGFFFLCLAGQGYAQINLDSSRRFFKAKPPDWKIGTQLQVGVHTLGVQAINQELQTEGYRAFAPIDLHVGFTFSLVYRKHLFGLGGYGHRAHNGDNFYLSQYNFGGNYQYLVLKKKSLEFFFTAAAHISILELRAIQPNPAIFPYSLLYTVPVKTSLGVGVDKCTGFKGLFGRSPRLDVRVGLRTGYALPFNNQWSENFNTSRPIDDVPMVNASGYFYLKFVVTSLIPLGS
ncbi:hypothetical protein [Microscilla marina]|uniref:hypothetical protein n=1 Tax=Microscilla marina TaxID=1027 RepID=UPI0002FDA73F|nr:hypothetical protein [Microscilla marina]